MYCKLVYYKPPPNIFSSDCGWFGYSFVTVGIYERKVGFLKDSGKCHFQLQLQLMVKANFGNFVIIMWSYTNAYKPEIIEWYS